MKKALLLLSLSVSLGIVGAAFTNSFWVSADDKPQTTTSVITVEQIREVGLRAGVIQLPQHATITVTKPAKVLNFEVGESSLLYQAVGVVEAAIDLNEVNEGDITLVGDATVIVLPAPVLTNASIDTKNSVVLDRQQAFVFAPDDKHFQAEAERTAISRFIQQACADSILKRSADNAQATVLALTRKLNLVNVRVEVKKPQECSPKENGNV